MHGPINIRLFCLPYTETAAFNKIYVDCRIIISVSTTQYYKILSNVITTKRETCFMDDGTVLYYV